MDDRICRPRELHHLGIGAGPPERDVEFIPQLVIPNVRLRRAVVVLEQGGDEVRPILDVVRRRRADDVVGPPLHVLWSATAQPGVPAASVRAMLAVLVAGSTSPCCCACRHGIVERLKVEIPAGLLDPPPGEIEVRERADRHLRVIGLSLADMAKKVAGIGVASGVESAAGSGERSGGLRRTAAVRLAADERAQVRLERLGEGGIEQRGRGL